MKTIVAEMKCPSFPISRASPCLPRSPNAGSFAAAARDLDLSVPTLSRGVARLEKRLGARVFNRTSRQLALTAFGSSLLGRATQLYRDAEEAEAMARDQSASPAAPFVLPCR